MRREGDREATSKGTHVSQKLTIPADPLPPWRKTPVRSTEAPAWWTLQVQVFVDAYLARPSAATKARAERILSEYAEAVRRGEVEPPVSRRTH
jgi:hypothetical protein